MTEGDAIVGVATETTVFLSHFEDLPDDRQRGRSSIRSTRRSLVMLAGAETVAAIARFGGAKLATLRRSRPLASGAPSHD